MGLSRGLALGMVLFVMSCSARAGGGGGFTDTDASTVTDTGSSSNACSDLCARVITTAGCVDNMGDCVSLCATGASLVPAACRSQYDAVTACGRTSAINCPTPSQVLFTDCTSQQSALTQCARP